MTDTQKFALWQNDEISKLNNNTFVVRNRASGQLMIKRVLSKDSFEVMQKVSRISCKYLMKVFDVSVIDNRCVCLCEYIDGIPLCDRVERYGTYTEKETKAIMLSVCDGLSALHYNGIVHRDIKPENIMIDLNGNVKIIDYDISREVKRGANQDTEILGTVGYASPEQFGFSQTDDKADIYSCGVLMNFLLTGKLINEEIYQGFFTPIIEKCTEIDKDKRYINISQLKSAILGKKTDDRKYRPLPGFRGKSVLLKIFMTVILSCYFLFEFYYIYAMITQDAGVSSDPLYIQICNFLIIFVFFTGLPYILFGDVGRLSRKLCKKDEEKGRYIEKALGILSIVIGVVILFTVVV